MRGKKSRFLKRAAAAGLSAILAFPTTMISAADKKENPVIFPEPSYLYTFDQGSSDNKVKNEGTKSGTAQIGGSEAKIVYDRTRGSEVLDLPGGGLNKGYLTLPENIWKDVTKEKGFTVSFWININEEADFYSRIFSSSSKPMNDSYAGGDGSWHDPEFSVVSGIGNGGAESYNSTFVLSDKIRTRINWDQTLDPGNWQQVAISVTEDAYCVYLDGEPVSITAFPELSKVSEIRQTATPSDTLRTSHVKGSGSNAEQRTNITATASNSTRKEGTANTTGGTLSNLFEELKNFKYSSVGRSIYQSDDDLKARIDDFSFYEEALTDSQIRELYSIHKESVEIPEPYYEFTFDGEATDGIVENEGSKKGISARIEGTGAEIVEDEERASHVLSLPGGGLDKGYLTLPEDMYQEVSQEGFSFSFWLNIDGNASFFSRIFSSSSLPLNSTNGGGKWNDPEFTFVAGGVEGTYDPYNTSVVLPDKSGVRLRWEHDFVRNQWQHVTISVTPDSYRVYLDGTPQTVNTVRGDLREVLKTLFDGELKNYKYNAIGRSLYTTDPDVKAKIDEFRFYNVALTNEQARAAYDNYQVSEELLKSLAALTDEAENVCISYYTRATYDTVQAAAEKARATLLNPVTENNVERVKGVLESAIEHLSFFGELNETTEFDNQQLKLEAEQADGMYDTLLYKDKNTELKKAVEAGKTVGQKEDAASQKEVDDALKALRIAVSQIYYGPALTFDVAESTGEMMHGATGFLYGVSENNVPSAGMLRAVRPKILVQKAADGKQHPSGDGYRLETFLDECGAENVQIYIQDYYLQWPYENNGIDDYVEVAREVVTKMTENKSAEELKKLSFVLFNEPDGIWYGWDVDRLCRDWKRVYDMVKKINPEIQVAGPNYSGYNKSAYETFFKYCRDYDCLPEYITWHELQKDKLMSFQEHYDHMQGLIEMYYADSDIEPEICVNETCNFDDVGAPGPLVNWISIFEQNKVHAVMAYWGLANSMNELAAESNKPNGAWWVYKWYAEMSGHSVKMTMEDVGNPGPYSRLYGLSSVDEEKDTIKVLFGGQAGSQTIKLENMNQISSFEDAASAHVKIYRTGLTGYQGFADTIPVLYEGNLPITGGVLNFTLKDADLMDACYAIVTPGTDDTLTAVDEYEPSVWTRTYEAEDAKLIGGARITKREGGSDTVRSNRAEVGSIDTENDGVEFTVNVPRDGKYRVNVYYSTQAPQVNAESLEYVSEGGQNRAIGTITTHSLTVDGQFLENMEYESTIKWGYFNYKTVYLDLEEGQHSIRIMHSGEDQTKLPVGSRNSAILDKIDVISEGDYGISKEEIEKTVIVEPEEDLGRNDNSFSMISGDSEYRGAGVIEGSGEFEFFVVVPEDGYYDMELRASGGGMLDISKNTVLFAEDASAESDIRLEWRELFGGVVLPESLEEIKPGSIYLAAGVNELKFTVQDICTIDRIVFSKNHSLTNRNEISVEAEASALSGTAVNDGYRYLKGQTENPVVIENQYCSDGKAVEGFRGGMDNELSFEVEAPETGNYIMSIYYTNDEPAPVMRTQAGSNYVHPYNIDLVERYAQIRVNGGEAKTVYFRNTFCWDVFKNVVIDIELEEGTNTIRITNDNSYKFSEVQDDFTPRFDKFVFAPAVLDGSEEVPEVDRIIVTAPDKTKYYIGEQLNMAGITVTAVYSDESEIILRSDEFTVSGFDSSTAGKKRVTISYGGKTASFEVEINAAQVVKLMLTVPDKTVYYIGESINTAGLTVKAEFSDGELRTVNIDEVSILGFDSSTAGKKEITVSYGGKSASFEVEIKSTHVTKLEVTAPDKTIYEIGESIDLTGMEVKAAFSDGRIRTIGSDEYEVKGFDSSKEGKNVITISYGGVGTTVELLIKAKSEKPQQNKVDSNDSSSNSVTAVSVSYPVSEGKTTDWRKDETGWRMLSDNGAYVRNEWRRVEGKWYFLNAAGYMVTGWSIIDQGKWYYFNGDGSMISDNWLAENNYWYYLNADGSMAIGWKLVNEKWYYFNPEYVDGLPQGAMLTDTTTPGGYHVDKEGVWIP